MFCSLCFIRSPNFVQLQLPDGTSVPSSVNTEESLLTSSFLIPFFYAKTTHPTVVHIPLIFFSLAVLSCPLTSLAAFPGTLSSQSTFPLMCSPKTGITDQWRLPNTKSTPSILPITLVLFTVTYHYGLTFTLWPLNYIISKSFHRTHTGPVYIVFEDTHNAMSDGRKWH